MSRNLSEQKPARARASLRRGVKITLRCTRQSCKLRGERIHFAAADTFNALEDAKDAGWTFEVSRRWIHDKRVLFVEDAVCPDCNS